MLSLPSRISQGALEGIYTWCQKCGAGCIAPVGEKFRDHLGERSIYCTKECWWQHGQERGFAPYGGYSNPIICEPPPDPNTIMPVFTPRLRPAMYRPPTTTSCRAPVLLRKLPVQPPQDAVSTPRYRNLSRPHPKDIPWPAPEIPSGGSGYGYPNVNWLHYMPDTEVFGYLIDSFRLRMQDIKSRPTTRLDIFYRDWNKDMAGFKHYLDLAEETPGLLPIGWKSKRAACENLCKLEPYYDLASLDALDKPSIIHHHDGDRKCIHRLRELAQAVFGYAPGNLNLSKL